MCIRDSPYTFGQIQDALEAAGFEADHAEVTMHAATQADINDIEQAQKIIKMIDMLEDLDDVQNVYTNVNFSEAVMDELNQ